MVKVKMWIARDNEGLAAFIAEPKKYYPNPGDENDYWWVAGDWKPEFTYNTARYAITNSNGFAGRLLAYDLKNYILEFPTEEMRDAFCENFKVEIESCKELL